MSFNETNPPVVERNGVSLQLEQQAFGKKAGDNAGKKFWAPSVDTTNLDVIRQWMGDDEAALALNKKLRSVFADIYIEGLKTEQYKATGQFDDAYLMSEWENFTTGRLSLSDLDEQIDDLTTMQMDYLSDPDFGARQLPEGMNQDKMTEEELLNYPLTARADELARLSQATTKKLRPLKAKKKEYEAIYAKRAAKRKESEAASPTKSN